MKRIPPLVSIREVRLAHGLSARAVADRIEAEEGIEVHPDSLLNIELGNRSGNVALLKAWARVLRLDPMDVYRPEELRARLASVDAESGAA